MVCLVLVLHILHSFHLSLIPLQVWAEKNNVRLQFERHLKQPEQKHANYHQNRTISMIYI